MNREKLFILVTDLLYFSFPNGLKIFLSRSKKTGEVNLSLKQYHAPITLRCGTTDFDTFDQIFKSREYQLPLAIGKDGVIIDAGANIGLASIWLTNKYPGVKIIALEPEDSNYKLLVRNTKPYQNIVCLKVALWNKNQAVHINDPARGKWGFTVGLENGGDEVEGVTVEELMVRCRITTIDFLKIDIEGAEVELFSAEENDWLLNTKALTVELHDRIRKESSRSFFRTMLQHDFLIEARGEKLFAFKSA